jgi:hypothetical protein
MNILNGRRRVTIAGATAAVAMVMGLAACGGDGDPVAQSETPRTVWGKITDDIGEDGSVDVDTALAAFSYAIAPLPGAQVPDGEIEELPDASIAIAWTLAHFDELTDE